MPKKGYRQSEEHKRKHIDKISGNKNGNWKGGIRANRNEYTKNWKKQNPIKAQIADRKAKIKRRGLLVGSFTFGEWQTMKIQYGHRCPCCKKQEPEIKLTIDHIIPVSKGGSNFIENIQPLCHNCNSKKYTKIIRFNPCEL